MAEDAVDAAVAEFPSHPAPSRTESTPLVGAAGYHRLWDSRHAVAKRAGLDVTVVERLLGRYGDRIEDLLEMIEERPDLGKPLDGGGDYLRAEIRYAASHEAALHLNDVLTRRTRISIEVPDRGVVAAGPAAELMAEVLGWGPATIERELEHYRTRVAAEVESQKQEDDQTADAARLGAPDVRRLGA